MSEDINSGPIETDSTGRAVGLRFPDGEIRYRFHVAECSCTDGSKTPAEMLREWLAAQRADLLAACKALVDEHRLFVRRDDWICPFCARAALSMLHFPHADDCAVVQARSAIAKAEEKKD